MEKFYEFFTLRTSDRITNLTYVLMDDFCPCFIYIPTQFKHILKLFDNISSYLSCMVKPESTQILTFNMDQGHKRHQICINDTVRSKDLAIVRFNFKEVYKECLSLNHAVSFLS